MTQTEHFNESHKELDTLLNERQTLNKKISNLIFPAIADIIRSFGIGATVDGPSSLGPIKENVSVTTLDITAMALDYGEHGDAYYEDLPVFHIADRHCDGIEYTAIPYKITIRKGFDGKEFLRLEIHDTGESKGYYLVNAPTETSYTQVEQLFEYLKALRYDADEGIIAARAEGQTIVLGFVDSGEDEE